MKRAAIYGCGIVGTGIAHILMGNAEGIAKNLGEGLELKYVLEKRDCSGEIFADKVVGDIDIILNDPEVEIVAECIGGIGIAYEFIKKSLLAGKSVVTCNKHLVAEKGLELLAIAKEKGVSFVFEASVGGGIPIIRPLTNCLAGNRIKEIFGIINGTTNYILTQMAQCGQGFDEALADAQRLGYAEADPTADVEGIDACRKICILADLSFGHNIPPAKVKTQGITCVSGIDSAFAEEFGCSIKLLGHTVQDDAGMVTTFVAPHLVPKSALLANVNGVMNAVVVRGDSVGECLFYGAGAGRYPTASAMVGDMMDCVRHSEGCRYIDWGEEKPELQADSDALPSRWYVRFKGDAIEAQAERGGEKAAIVGPMSAYELREKLGEENILAAFRVLD
ncbi:MAG: homoserine dehydrogenase [Oscillospiraceae bacterium]|nr:homoserine dehydrogenase [Oscillospiraceae bacterium]